MNPITHKIRKLLNLGRHVRLIVSQKQERRANALLEALRVLDRQMSGNETYEHAWVNHPTTPEESPASLVRKAISENAE